MHVLVLTFEYTVFCLVFTAVSKPEGARSESTKNEYLLSFSRLISEGGKIKPGEQN